MYIYKKDTVLEIRMVHMLHMLCKHELRCHFLMSLLNEEKKWCAYNCDKIFHVIIFLGHFHKITRFS